MDTQDEILTAYCMAIPYIDGTNTNPLILRTSLSRTACKNHKASSVDRVAYTLDIPSLRVLFHRSSP